MQSSNAAVNDIDHAVAVIVRRQDGRLAGGEGLVGHDIFPADRSRPRGAVRQALGRCVGEPLPVG